MTVKQKYEEKNVNSLMKEHRQRWATDLFREKVKKKGDISLFKFRNTQLGNHDDAIPVLCIICIICLCKQM